MSLKRQERLCLLSGDQVMMNLWTAQLVGGWLMGRWLMGIRPGAWNQGAKAAKSSGLALPVHALGPRCSSIHLAFLQSVFLFSLWGGTIPKTDPGGRLYLEVPGLATRGRKTERQKSYIAKWWWQESHLSSIQRKARCILVSIQTRENCLPYRFNTMHCLDIYRA